MLKTLGRRQFIAQSVSQCSQRLVLGLASFQESRFQHRKARGHRDMDDWVRSEPSNHPGKLHGRSYRIHDNPRLGTFKSTRNSVGEPLAVGTFLENATELLQGTSGRQRCGGHLAEDVPRADEAMAEFGTKTKREGRLACAARARKNHVRLGARQ